jgi:hypothetical protein
MVGPTVLPDNPPTVLPPVADRLGRAVETVRLPDRPRVPLADRLGRARVAHRLPLAAWVPLDDRLGFGRLPDRLPLAWLPLDERAGLERIADRGPEMPGGVCVPLDEATGWTVLPLREPVTPWVPLATTEGEIVEVENTPEISGGVKDPAAAMATAAVTIAIAPVAA